MKAARIIAGGLLLVAGTALADTRAGVEAWKRGDYRLAVREWRDAAKANDADAQFNIGQAYKLGRGVPVDLVMAESWYQKAAAQGHPDGETNYGLILFQNGKRAEARPWLERAAARGEPRAQLVLGTMLYNGDGVPRDWPRAYALMVRASGSGMEQATQVRAQMDQYIPEDQRRAGLDLARQYEAQAQRPPLPPVALAQADAAAPPKAGGRANAALRAQSVPPSMVEEPAMAPARPLPAPGVHGRGRVPPPIEPSRPLPTTRSAPPVRPAPAPAKGRGWRVQFGAFRDEGNARTLWETLKADVPALAQAQPFLVHAGSLTRLQAGPFVSAGEAGRICGRVKAAVPDTPCVPVAP